MPRRDQERGKFLSSCLLWVGLSVGGVLLLACGIGGVTGWLAFLGMADWRFTPATR